jgi:hypothetical protein
MKEKILESLKTKYSNLGLSENILSDFASMIALSVTTEEGIEKAVNDCGSVLKTIQSSADKLRSEHQKKIAELQKQQQPKTEPQQEDKPKPNPKGDEPPEWATKMMSTFEGLVKEIGGIKAERTTERRKAEFDKVIGSLPDFARKVYAKTDYSKMTDEQFSALLTETSSEVESFNKEFKAKGGVFGTPKFGENVKKNDEPQATKEELGAVMSKIQW